MKRGDETRDRLLEVIQDVPGINKLELCQRTGLGWGTVFRHVKILEERGDLEVLRDGRATQIFPAAVPPEQRRWLTALHDDEAEALLEEIQKRGEGRTQELAGDLGISRKVVRRHLSVLCDAGLLRRSDDYHPRFEPVDADGVDVT